MEMISSRLITALQTLGLPHLDAKVYTALFFLNSVGAKELIDFIDISKPSVYESLQKLEERGFVLKSNTKPAVFTAVSPRVTIDILTQEHSRAAEIALEEFESLQKSRKIPEESDAIWTVFGEKNVEPKIRDMLSSATVRIDCLMGERYLSLFANLKIRAPLTLYILAEDDTIITKAEEILLGITSSVTFIPLHSMTPLGPPILKKKKKSEFFDPRNIFELIIDDWETLSIPPMKMTKTTGLHSTTDVLVSLALDRMQTIIETSLTSTGEKVDHRWVRGSPDEKN